MADLITSADNAQFKLWASLQASKGIDKHGLALVSGRKIVPELLAERGGDGTTLIVRASARLPALLGAKEVIVSAALFEALDEFGTDMPLLVVPVPQVAQRDISAPPQGLTLAVAAQDPANLGAILRSAFAFDAKEVVLLSESAHPFLPRVTRAASGANFHVALSNGPSIRAITEDWIAFDMAGEALDTFDFPRNARLLLGEEGMGIPSSFTGKRLRISINPRAESLNVAVAAGIALAAYRRQHPL